MTTVPFNQIASDIVAPIFAFEVNSGGQYESSNRMLLVGHKASTGEMDADVPVFAATQTDVDRLAGPKSILRDMYRRARANAPTVEIWIASAAAVGTSAVWTLTIASPPAAGGVGVLWIAGEKLQLTLAAGATAANVATDLAALVDGFFDPQTRATLPVEATVLGAVVTLTAVHGGALLDDLDIWVDTTVTANAFASGVLTIAHPTAGTGTPSVAGVIAAMGDDPFTTVITPFGDDTNIERWSAAMDDTSGRWSWVRQIYGHVWTVRTGSVSALATAGSAFADDRHLTVLARLSGAGDFTPSWAWITAYAAKQAPWLHGGSNGNVSRNMTGLALSLVRPPRTRAAHPAYDVRDALLRSRLSTWKVDGGRVVVDKAVTLYASDGNGLPDTVFRDVQALYQLMYALAFFRTRLSAEHGRRALADDNPGGVGVISTPADIRATFVHAYDDLVRRGVFENGDGFAARVVVTRNLDNPNRVDVLAPLDRVNPLDVIAANATLYSQYR